MKAEPKNNKIGYIYFSVILGYIVGKKNQIPQEFIIVHPYFKQHIDKIFLLCVWHILVVTWKKDSQQFAIKMVLKIRYIEIVSRIS